MVALNEQKKESYKAAVYCRIASASQVDTHAIESQRKTLNTFAQQQGYTVYSEYLDCGYNGHNFKRPAFMQMESDIQAGNVDTVLVRSIDRIARDVFLREKWIKGLSKYGVEIVAMDGSHELHSLVMDEVFRKIIGKV